MAEASLNIFNKHFKFIINDLTNFVIANTILKLGVEEGPLTQIYKCC